MHVFVSVILSVVVLCSVYHALTSTSSGFTILRTRYHACTFRTLSLVSPFQAVGFPYNVKVEKKWHTRPDGVRGDAVLQDLQQQRGVANKIRRVFLKITNKPRWVPRKCTPTRSCTRLGCFGQGSWAM